MTLVDSTFEALALPPKIQFLPEILCQVKYEGIFPRIPGSHIDFTWEFDLNTKYLELKSYNKEVNDFTIFLPYNYFGEYANSTSTIQMCKVTGDLAQCSFSHPGILNVRPLTPIQIGKIISISLLNVPFGAMDEDYIFLCSVNNVTNNIIFTLLKGSGKMMPHTVSTEGMVGIVQKAKYQNTYNLNFYSSLDSSTEFSTSNSTLDEASTLTLLEGIDLNGRWMNQGLIILTKIPIFHIFLPEEYNNLEYSSTPSKPIMEINEISVDNITLAETRVEVELNLTEVSGRRVSASFM